MPNFIISSFVFVVFFLAFRVFLFHEIFFVSAMKNSNQRFCIFRVKEEFFVQERIFAQGRIFAQRRMYLGSFFIFETDHARIHPFCFCFSFFWWILVFPSNSLFFCVHVNDKQHSLMFLSLSGQRRIFWSRKNFLSVLFIF